MPLFDKKDKSRYAVFTRRALGLGGAMSAVFCVLGGRLYQLQIRNGQEYLVEAEDNRVSERLIAPPRGRILDRFGVELVLDERGVLVDKDGGLAALVGHCARRAQGWYDDGLRLVPLLDPRSAASCRAMAGIYRQLLARIAASPSSVYDRRLSLSGWQKLTVAARALTGAGS